MAAALVGPFPQEEAALAAAAHASSQDGLFPPVVVAWVEVEPDVLAAPLSRRVAAGLVAVAHASSQDPCGADLAARPLLVQ